MDLTWGTGALSSCHDDAPKFAWTKKQPVVIEVVALNSVRREDYYYDPIPGCVAGVSSILF